EPTNLTAPATARPALEAPSRIIRLLILEVYRRLRAVAAVAVMDKVAEEEVEGPASIHEGMVVVEAHILKIPVMLSGFGQVNTTVLVRAEQ
ncbi:MAG: hypothetical protein Q9210_006377, partial [Variospora velana]